jgi:uncharacterized membrane protein
MFLVDLSQNGMGRREVVAQVSRRCLHTSRRCAIMGPCVFLTTVLLRFPIVEGLGPDHKLLIGYMNLGDIAVLLVALYHGPRVGMVSGGLGSALADLLTGYPRFSLITLVAKGCEGFLAGLFRTRRGLWMTVPGLAMTLIYFVGESMWLCDGYIEMPLREVPFNVLQWVSASFVNVYLLWSMAGIRWTALLKDAHDDDAPEGLTGAHDDESNPGQDHLVHKYTALLGFLAVLAWVGIIKLAELQGLIDNIAQKPYVYNEPELTLDINIDAIAATLFGILVYVLFLSSLLILQVSVLTNFYQSPKPNTRERRLVQLTFSTTALFTLAYLIAFCATWQKSFDKNIGLFKDSKITSFYIKVGGDRIDTRQIERTVFSWDRAGSSPPAGPARGKEAGALPR